jgi:glycosyltransferase involved in cell wall biosynthesis
MAAILDRPAKTTEWGICHSFAPYLPLVTTPRRVLYTTIETTRIPEEWANITNTADAVLVPSESLYPYLRASGVTAPLYRVILPIDSRFTYQEREQRDTFTFLCFGALMNRKMPIHTITAFRRAFPTQQNVRLIMKSIDHAWGTSHHSGALLVDDLRITIIDRPMSVPELVNLCYQADAGVFLSHGESSFLSPQELAATGVTSLVPDHSGCSEWVRDDCFYPVGLDQERPYVPSLHPNWGQQWNMDMEQVVETLRCMYQNQKQVREKGKKAAEWISSRFTVEQSIDEMLTVLNKVS